jgi:hypothetical protein
VHIWIFVGVRMADGIRLTWIVRLSDGLTLCGSTEPMTQSNEERGHKQQMKQIVSSLQRKRPDQDACVVPLGSTYVMYSGMSCMASALSIF